MREYKATWKLFAVINHQYVGIHHTKALTEKDLTFYSILFLFYSAMFYSTLKYFKKNLCKTAIKKQTRQISK